MSPPSDSSTKITPGSSDAMAPLADQVTDLPSVQQNEVSWFTPNARTVVGGEDDWPWKAPRDFPLPQIPGYRIEQEIGRGGMGVVLKAHDEALHRPVAIKMVLNGEFADARDLQRFRAEAQVIAQLRHPHIVNIFSIGDVAGRPYFALEYLPGGTLADRILGRVQEPRACAELMVQIAKAIHHAHAQGIIHRDLKPNNILFDAEQIPRITDFGLAKLIQDQSLQADAQRSPLTRAGMIVGTPQYMAPEQASGGTEPITPSVDVYSLGVILYEMLTGRRPFDAVHPIDVFMRVRTEEPIPPRLLQPSIPKDLETICLKCLAKMPTHRYESALAMAKDLERFLNHEPILARPAGWLEKSLKWVRRHPSWSLAILILFLSVLVIGIINWVYTSKLELALKDVSQARSEEMKQRERAEENFDRAVRTIEDLLLRVGADRLVGVPHMDEIRRDILQDALKRFKELFTQESSRPQLKRQIARSLSVMGVLEERLGTFKEAELHLSEAWTIFEELLRQDPNREDWLDGLDTTLQSLARTRRAMGQYAAAQAVVDRLKQLREVRLLHFPDDVNKRIAMAAFLNDHVYTMHYEQGRLQEAIAALKQGYQQITLIQADAPNHLELRRLAILLSSNLAKDMQESDPLCLYYCTQAMAQLRKLSSHELHMPEFRYYAAVVERRFAEIQAKIGFSSDKVLAHLESSTHHAEGLVREFPAVPLYKQTLALSLDRQAEYLFRFHPERYAECLTLRTKAEELLSGLLTKPQGDSHQLQHQLAGVLHNQASLLHYRKEWEGAISYLEKAMSHTKAALRAAPQNPAYLLYLQNHLHSLGLIHAQLGRIERCEDYLMQLKDLSPKQPEAGVIAARLYLFLADQIQSSTMPDKEKPPIIERCCQSSLAALELARRSGFNITSTMLGHARFQRLQSRPDFQAWRELNRFEKNKP